MEHDSRKNQSSEVSQPPAYARLTNEVEGPSSMHTMVVINDDRSRPVVYQPPPLVQSFSGHILLSCCSFWCCGFLFGAISFILAVIAQNYSTSMSNKDRETARRLGTASMVFSVFGIVLGAVLVVLFVGLAVAGAGIFAALCPFTVDGQCFLHQSLILLCPDNAHVSGIHCYYN